MLRSMYAGVSGMKGFQTKLDVIGNNISNVNTIGYKKSTINFQDLLSQNMSGGGANPMQVGLGASTGAINVNHNAGSSMTTGVGTDLAMMGDGFFIVQNPDDVGTDGGQYLTRAGNFTVTNEGNLVNPQGYNVMGFTNTAAQGDDFVAGDLEAIVINPNDYDSFSINRAGEVIGKAADGTETILFGLGISNPENPTGLNKFGGSLYEMTGGASALGINAQTVEGANTSVASGMLEMSNVDLTEEFTEMIIAQRGFQANSRTITTSDEILQEVVNLKR
ncbi:flagellar hook-basal body complex protein [Planomicrobium sp. MB-3u-38]|uniref:flagellar hook-basal body complex protein n=1 Tax=Planomicrobium sp. MB-3u-38 TaxID=2058318 RepID=UPI000C7D50EE|nr:flagellar hook-basal body complex protein [Planomicrobium sp. MB-3u-38]PKH10390.1 flagellar basal body rod protein FlgG [Planomicrobium sp. MB-3u-38]